MSDLNRPPAYASGNGTWRLMLGAIAVLLVMFFLFWWNSAMDIPKMAIPNPTMPRPNAFDAYIRAGSLLLDDTKIGFALNTRHATGNKDDHVYTLADEGKLVSENAPALAALRQGLNEEYVNPPVRSFSTLLPYYARFRGLSRLLELESVTKAQKGDWAGAVRSDLDAVQMGEQIPHGSVLIGGLVGDAIQAIGRKTLWDSVDHLDAKQSRAGVQRLEKIRALHFPFADTLQEEKWAGQAGLLEMLRSRNFAAAMNNAGGGNTSPVAPAASQLFFLAYSKRRIMNDYTNYMDAEIARARQPYAAQTAPTPIPNNPIMQTLAPAFNVTKLKDTANETQNDLLLLSFALRAYFVEHHAYPSSLNALVPNYLNRLPDDPFALKGSFQYQRTGNRYVLYNVGPDGNDDGGKPIDTGQSHSSSPNERYFIKQESTGDVVAGVNKW